jgi:signal transduction histidine kinase
MQAAELQAEKNRAEEASKAKGDFLAVMSHEIVPLLQACSGW